MATYTVTTTPDQDIIIAGFLKVLTPKFASFQAFLDSWFAALMTQNATVLKTSLIDDAKDQLPGLNTTQLQQLIAVIKALPSLTPQQIAQVQAILGLPSA